jgi:uncharacterized repeat protein (TIGR02543 family)
VKKEKKNYNHGLRGFIFICVISVAAAFIMTGCGGDTNGGENPDPGNQITVNFNLGDGVSGTPPTSVTIANGTALGDKYPQDPTRAGAFDFNGWYNSGTVYTRTKVINASGATFTLTAEWDDHRVFTQNPAIHPGNHFSEAGGTEKTVKVNDTITVSGLFANVEAGAGVLSAKWYRATTQTMADAAPADAPTGTVINTQTSTTHEISLSLSTTETVAGVYWYYVVVTNTNANATEAKTSNAITQNKLKVTVTPADPGDPGDSGDPDDPDTED